MPSFLLPTKLLIQGQQADFDQHVQDLVNQYTTPPSDSLTNPLGSQHDVSAALPSPPEQAAAEGQGSDAGAAASPAGDSPAPDSSAALPAPTAPVTAPLVASPPTPTAPVTAPLVAPPGPTGGTPFQQKVYQQAAAVQNQTGVDPAIIATIASTETGATGQNAGNLTLGIGTAAGAAGAGPIVWGNPTPEGGRQPSGFYAYTNGAEAAQAFRNYIERWQPQLVPYLNDASKFFDPNGPIKSSNYYVPTAAEAARAGGASAATANYYGNWQNIANTVSGGSSSAPSVPSTGASAQPQSQPSIPVVTGAQNALSGIGSAIGNASTAISSTANDAQQAFDQHINDLTGGAVNLGQQATSTASSAADEFTNHVKQLTGGLVDLSGNTSVLNGPTDTSAQSQPPGVGSISDLSAGAPGAISSPPPPPTPPQNPLEVVKQKFSDAMDSLGSALGGLINGTPDIQANRSSPGAQAAMGQAASMLPTNPLEAAGGSGLGVPTSGEQLNAERNQYIAENNPLRDVPVAGGVTTNVAQMATDPTNLLLAAAPAAKVAEAVAPSVSDALAAAARSRLPAQATPDFASGGLTKLMAHLGLYPAEVRQGLEDFVTQQSAAGKTPQEIGDTVIQWMQDNPPAAAAEQVANVASQLPNAPRARAIAADVASGGSRQERLAANDVYQGAEPPVEPGQPFTRTPQGDIVPTTEQPSNVALQGLINQAKAKGYDTSALEAQLRPPAVQYDAFGNQVSQSVPQANQMQNVTPQGTLAPGQQNIPGPAGGATTAPSKLPSKIISARAEQAAPPLPPDQLPAKAGIRPQTMQIAYQRIEKALGPGDKADAAMAQLDQMVQSGAPPDAITRLLTGTVEGRNPGIASGIRTVRTGSMAGDLPSMAKAVLNLPVQIAMRAPVAAITDVLSGHPENIGAGLRAGFGSLGEASALLLQDMRYGTNYEAALTGGLGGGFGFMPGVDVMGPNTPSRLAGTAALGLVRTHGAMADLTATIGRNVALARGATPEQAMQIGQDWSMRSGNYGTIGQMVSDKLEGLRGDNPATDVLGQVLVPFLRVAYNEITKGVERSPVGLLGTLADVARAQLPEGAGAALRGPYATGGNASRVTALPQRLANNMFGVGLATLGYMQAVSGNVTGEHPRSSDPKWSVRIGGQWVPLRFFGIAGESLGQAASLYEAQRDGRGDVQKIATHTAEEYAAHVYDASWLRSIADTLGLVSNAFVAARDAGAESTAGQSSAARAGGEVRYQGGNLVHSFIPQYALGKRVVETVAGGGIKAPFQAPTSTKGQGTPRTAQSQPLISLPFFQPPASTRGQGTPRH